MPWLSGVTSSRTRTCPGGFGKACHSQITIAALSTLSTPVVIPTTPLSIKQSALRADDINCRTNRSSMNKNANIVLVHGAWADGSCWSKVLLLLKAKGHNATAAQIPLTSLADDIAVTQRL